MVVDSEKLKEKFTFYFEEMKKGGGREKAFKILDELDLSDEEFGIMQDAARMFMSQFKNIMWQFNNR